MSTSFIAQSLSQTQDIGLQLAQAISFPACVYLNGDMGAGKTTLAKAIIAGYGYAGAVTSPTYNLVQEYQVDQGIIFHMDLYRLEEAEELEYLALEDLWSDRSLFLVEWPERGAGFLRAPDWQVAINKVDTPTADSRQITLEQSTVLNRS